MKLSQARLVNESRRFLVVVLFLLFEVTIPSPVPAVGTELSAADGQESVEELPDQLWFKSQELLEDGKIFPAAGSFNRFFVKFPDHPQAEEALWQSATLYREIAEASEQPDWEKVGNLFREYSSAFKGTARAEEAYIEVARAHIEMKSLREGLSYINLFMKRYPSSIFTPRVLAMKADLLMKIGRREEALELCRKFIVNKSEDYRHQYPIIASIFLDLGQPDIAVSLVDQAVSSIAPLSEELFRVLAVKGRSLTLMDSDEKTKKGQEILFYLANVSEDNKLRSQVFFDVAESVLKSGEKAAAQHLYDKVLALVGKNERAAVFSRFRISLIGDEQRRANELQNKAVLENPAGDQPYLEVLENFPQYPIAQDARLGLMKRVLFRGESDNAFDLGKAYLQNGGGDARKTVIGALGGILVKKIEGALAEGKNPDAFELYRREHAIVQEYPEGRLLFLVGQALEAMNLYDQASVVYYRAVALNHPDDQKSELYMRRAALYIKNGDFTAAERLLNYLADIYQEQRESGEVFHLTGQLRSAQGKIDEAAEAFARAMKVPETGERRSVYAAALVRVLHAQKKLEEMAVVLAEAADKKWLAGEELQTLYGLLGDTRLERGEGGLALKAYRAAIEDGLPTEGERVQTIHLRLGDILASWGITDKSRKHYQFASKGSNERWSQVALERLQQDKIDQSVAGLRGVLDK
ncbi:MAG: hypothetical protein KKG47_01860 [Proteobacteria bacterium]|nr:hypothetical protein [Pseudomonadota bacterium]MBU1737322.1 hypothetical protein [Pseudomonadota bacterium]